MLPTMQLRVLNGLCLVHMHCAAPGPVSIWGQWLRQGFDQGGYKHEDQYNPHASRF